MVILFIILSIIKHTHIFLWSLAFGGAPQQNFYGAIPPGGIQQQVPQGPVMAGSSEPEGMHL